MLAAEIMFVKPIIHSMYGGSMMIIFCIRFAGGGSVTSPPFHCISLKQGHCRTRRPLQKLLVKHGPGLGVKPKISFLMHVWTP